MALQTLFGPWLEIGTAAERPVNAPQAALFFATDTNTLQVGADGTYYSVNPTFTTVANIAALKAIAAENRYNGLVVSLASDGSLWYFSTTSVLTGQDILVVTPTAGTGRWLRLPGGVDLAIPFTAAAADGTVLFTFPTGSRFQWVNAYWEITGAPTGGTDSTIGVASNKTSFTAAGGLLGGSAGDGSTALTVGIVPGTIGTAVDSVAKLHSAVFVPTDTITHERITSVFTTGSGFVHLVGNLVKNTGA